MQKTSEKKNAGTLLSLNVSPTLYHNYFRNLPRLIDNINKNWAFFHRDAYFYRATGPTESDMKLY